MNIKEVFEMGWPPHYVGSVQPTKETALQSRSRQDRSKYMGDGQLRDEDAFVTFEEEEVSEDG